MKKVTLIVMWTAMIAMFAVTNHLFAAEFLLMARDFEGAVVTGDPDDNLDGFTWGSCWHDDFQEVEDYNEAGAVYIGINTDSFPEVSIFAGVASDQYRVWIYQMDESWDRSLEISIGSDQAVKVGFDIDQWGSYWKWLDLGIHEVSEDTEIKVKAVGDFANHGQPFKQRRGGFMALLLTTDTTDQYPVIDMEENRCGLEIDNDSDGDGVFDGDDFCSETSLGALVDENGCSGRQKNIDNACPCDIDPPWKNHGQYVSCVSKTAEEQLDSALIDQAEKDTIVSERAQSDCGKKK